MIEAHVAGREEGHSPVWQAAELKDDRMSGLDQVYVKNDSFVYREIAGEAILVPIYGCVDDMASVYTFDEVGARIWSLVDGSRTVRQVCDAVLQEFQATPDEVETDVLEFVQLLLSMGALGPA